MDCYLCGELEFTPLVDLAHAIGEPCFVEIRSVNRYHGRSDGSKRRRQFCSFLLRRNDIERLRTQNVDLNGTVIQYNLDHIGGATLTG